MLTAHEFEADDPGLNEILVAGAKAGIPVNVMASGKLPLLLELALRNPDTQVVIDHVGLVQPFLPPVPPKPFGDLNNVIACAAADNVVIKISGAGTLSHQPFPYSDIWDPLSQVFDAFGLDRCMWGTHWTRAVELLNYEQGVEALEGVGVGRALARRILKNGALPKSEAALQAVVLLNAPGFVRGLMTVARPFFSRRLVEKINFCGAESTHCIALAR